MKPLGLVAALAILPLLAMNPVVASNVIGSSNAAIPDRIDNPAPPADKSMDRNHKRFKAMDQNKDSMVSTEEWTDSTPNRPESISKSWTRTRMVS